MKTIRYEFCDGTVSEVEVSNELYAVHEQLVQEEKRNHKRETRRHVSLDYLNGSGIDFEAPGSDPLAALIKRVDVEKLYNAMVFLSDKQYVLVEKVFWGNISLRETAKQTGLSHQA